jgi:Leucine-rich repeat (LRR) protein
LIVLILGSCYTKKDTEGLPSSHVEETPLAISETALEKATDDNNANQYKFEYANGTYYDMNDLTYFLSDTSIKSLRLYGGTFTDLSPLAELTELEELGILGNRYITDISPIGPLVNLKKLTLFNSGYGGSIKALSSLVNLENLVLRHNDRYYRELVPLQRLEVLNLTNAIMKELDVSYIAQIPSLKDLTITGGGDPEGILNIERLKNLVNLERLSISSNNNLDISWITHLQKLRELEMQGCTIGDIRPLLELPNLVSVRLYRMEVKDITPLLESRSIKDIDGLIVKDGRYEGELIRLFRERGIQFIPYYSDR